MIVLDSCAAVDIVRETPDGLALAQLMLEGEETISPDLFPTEVCNAFWKYRHAGMLSSGEIMRYVEKATGLVDELCDSKDLLHEAMSEAMRLDHPVYDMLYFVLARRNSATLFTIDRKLQQLCLDNGVNCVFTDTEF